MLHQPPQIPRLTENNNDGRCFAPAANGGNTMGFRKILALSLPALVLAIGTAQAAEPDSCQKIHMADVGWTDNTAQNGLFNVVVTALGYKTKIDVLDLPVILEG